ncbi:hypothetical protein Glove_379g16 [Diversispora epigaea]|uniref:PiggyBac transposable element-derived protein domain-containing protein n=1 Tax=Diversispora epigaea TaxID=1348612 RepID=A0A397H4I9_9GLOM|nr:hypothetical protein Glove_379g16 [Diversispora epigaea]
METSTFDEENNDTLYIAELARNNYENYEENELENDENNDIQEELLQNTIVRGTNRGRGQGRSRGRGRENNDTLYIAELARNNYENYEENELENDENNDIQEELLQNTIVRGTNRGIGQGRSRGRGQGQGRGHGQGYSQSHEKTQQLPPPPSFNKFQHLKPLHEFTNKDNKYPEHKITTFMSLLRFEQIKRFIHISDCSIPPLYWYSKLDPLANHIQKVSKSICIPLSNVSIDEMIARFSGRSVHIVRIKNKPTPEGYKILSLCDAGYTYTFIFTSRIQNYPELEQLSNLNKIGNEVNHLVSQLPLNKSFNIYMDNFFSSINLYQHLYNNNFGTCETVRTNSANFPKILKISKKVDWDTLSGVVNNNVLAVLWMDNGPVTIENRIERIRRRPQETNTNAAKVRAIFGNASKKALPIPRIIDDYNHFMGGVDIADQLRGYYGTQLPVRRTWMPLFFWLLDTSIINSYLIFKKSGKNTNHKDFRLQLVWDLIKSSMEENEPSKPNTRDYIKELTQQFKFIQVDPTKKHQYVITNFELSPIRLTSDGHFPEWREERSSYGHFPEWREERSSCVWCKYLNKKAQKKALRDPSQSQLYCIKCNVALCCNKNRSSCFKDYHTHKDDNN